jgi:hypothetical protein
VRTLALAVDAQGRRTRRRSIEILETIGAPPNSTVLGGARHALRRRLQRRPAAERRRQAH